ncbi:MAG: hypothetical protein WC627_11785 [Legionella sp.]|jgi:mevalonate kinase
MKWRIPAKTFLVGEYAAVAGASALILTTTPYFELALTSAPGLAGIHNASPAGCFWQDQNLEQGLVWSDPYQGIGGMGASSAQFLGAYLAACSIKSTAPILDDLLTSYYHYAWSGLGLRPSAYDLIAQAQGACVFINKQQELITTYSWPFTDLSFLLIHSGTKLATHDHLKETNLPNKINELSEISESALQAIEAVNSALLIDAVNNYHQKLLELAKVAPHSVQLIEQLKSSPHVLAIKGCGAMGADVLLVLCKKQNKLALIKELGTINLRLLATEEQLSPLWNQGQTLEKSKNIPQKT